MIDPARPPSMVAQPAPTAGRHPAAPQRRPPERAEGPAAPLWPWLAAARGHCAAAARWRVAGAPLRSERAQE
ncbi:hypothetical protein [Allonocardiopsis opalescens]|uniref:hypothetical protein n=1 Tax=Allonocardiopsis opalescens TaxID=1144618 RepID=UPI0011B1D28E|nr:hypothetical protein [Allonocardiopsis opalescens]